VTFEFSATFWLLGTKYSLSGNHIPPIPCYELDFGSPKLFTPSRGGLLVELFPDQEPCVRDFTKRCDRRISSWDFLQGTWSSWEINPPTPRGGGFLSIKVVNRVLDTRLIQWLGWVFATKERKRESSLGDKRGEHPGVYLLRTNWVRTNHLSHED